MGCDGIAEGGDLLLLLRDLRRDIVDLSLSVLVGKCSFVEELFIA